jgi:hypothetical protein
MEAVHQIVPASSSLQGKNALGLKDSSDHRYAFCPSWDVFFFSAKCYKKVGHGTSGSGNQGRASWDQR